MIFGISFLVLISLIFITIFSNNLINAEVNSGSPSWLKIIGSWWLEGTITDTELFNLMVFLVDQNILQTSENEKIDIKKLNAYSVSDPNKGEFKINYMRIENYGEEPYPGRIIQPEPRQKEIKPEKIEKWLHHTQYFEKQVDFLNANFKLPNDIIIGLGECQQKKAGYNEDTKMILICYELILDIHDRLTEEYKPKGLTEKQISKITLNVVDHIFYHQISYVILGIISNDRNITVSNINEFFIDSLSYYVKEIIQKDKENYPIENIFFWSKIMNEAKNSKAEYVWNPQLFEFERLSKIACQVSSFNSTMTLDYIQKGILKQQQILECKSKFINQKEDLGIIISQILK